MNQRGDFTHNGGFPLTQFTLSFMQESYRTCFMALANLIGDKVIVQGCNVASGQVSNGWVSIGGELMPFVGGILPPDALVKISESTLPRVFDDGATHNVYYTKTASIGSPGSFAFGDLKRVSLYKDLVDSLANLITAFNAHTHSWADLTGKPAYYISYRGSYNLPDVNSTDITRTVVIPDQGTSDYHVIGSWVGNNSNWNFNNDVLPPNIYEKTGTSFKMGIREGAAEVQNIRFEFVIIKSI